MNTTIIRHREPTYETKEEKQMRWHGDHIPYTASGVDMVSAIKRSKKPSPIQSTIVSRKIG